MARFLILLAVAVFSTAQADTCKVVQGPSLGDLCPAGLVHVCGNCCRPLDVVKCEDKLNPKTPGLSDCPKMASYCTVSTYLDLMKEQCPKTCGFCTAGCPPPAGTCVDKINPNTGTSDCPRMTAYCTRADYATLMRQECPKSCGFC